jgi:succinate dehydrogenase cytochrome b556 subunit
MAAITSRVSTFVEGVLYRGREGHLAFIFHRVSGLAILFFLAIHIVDTSFVYFWPEGYGEAIELYSSPVFLISEYALFAAIIYHSINGLNIIIKDAFPSWWSKHLERNSFWKVIILSVLAWLPAAYFVTRNLTGYFTGVREPAPSVKYVTDLANFVIPAAFIVILGVLAYGGVLNADFASKAPRYVARPGRNFETWSWLFMRWSGALLFALVWIHVLANALLTGAHHITLAYVSERWANAFTRGSAFAILLFAFMHGMNGLRYILTDYIPSERWHGLINIVLFVVWAVITALGATALINGVRGA